MRNLFVMIAVLASALSCAAIKDDSGNPVTRNTVFGRVDGSTGTVGEILDLDGGIDTNAVIEIANEAITTNTTIVSHSSQLAQLSQQLPAAAQAATNYTDAATNATLAVWNAEKSGYVPWANATHNAVTIGSRESGSAIGDGSLAQGENVKATGYYTRADGYYTHAEGGHTHAEGYYTHAEGYYTHAEGSSTHAEGSSTRAEGYHTHAEGYHTRADGYYTHAEGDHTRAEDYSTHAEGYSTHAEGSHTHAEGYSTHAEGSHTHAEGINSHAKDSNSFVYSGEDRSIRMWNEASLSSLPNRRYYFHGFVFRAKQGGSGLSPPVVKSYDPNEHWELAPGYETNERWEYLPDMKFYESHGPGTFNVNPTNGLAGFWIGETNLHDHIVALAGGGSTTGAVHYADEAWTAVSNAATTAYRDATNYTDAATNALSRSVSHPTSLWSDSDPTSIACTNRVDSFGNLYAAELTVGEWHDIRIPNFSTAGVRLSYIGHKDPSTGLTDSNGYFYRQPNNGRYWLKYNSLSGSVTYGVINWDVFTSVGTAPVGLDPTISGTDIPVTWKAGYGGTFTPQGAPVFSPAPYDRFARASELAGTNATLVAANAYTDAATNATLAAANAHTLSALTNTDATAWAETSATNSLAFLATHHDPADPDFSNAVVSVALPIGTNDIAAINAILNALGGLPLGEGAVTIGGLLAALAAAVAWLKRNKADLGTDGKVKPEQLPPIVADTHYPIADATALPDESEGADETLVNYKCWQLADETINNLTLDETSVPTGYAVKIYLPDALAPVGGKTVARDLILRLQCDFVVAPSVTFTARDTGGVGFEAQNESWGVVKNGINYFAFSESAANDTEVV